MRLLMLSSLSGVQTIPRRGARALGYGSSTRCREGVFLCLARNLVWNVYMQKLSQALVFDCWSDTGGVPYLSLSWASGLQHIESIIMCLLKRFRTKFLGFHGNSSKENHWVWMIIRLHLHDEVRFRAPSPCFLRPCSSGAILQDHHRRRAHWMQVSYLDVQAGVTFTPIYNSYRWWHPVLSLSYFRWTTRRWLNDQSLHASDRLLEGTKCISYAYAKISREIRRGSRDTQCSAALCPPDLVHELSRFIYWSHQDSMFSDRRLILFLSYLMTSSSHVQWHGCSSWLFVYFTDHYIHVSRCTYCCNSLITTISFRKLHVDRFPSYSESNLHSAINPILILGAVYYCIDSPHKWSWYYRRMWNAPRNPKCRCLFCI